MKESVYILEFPSNLGLKEPAEGKEPGVRKMPDFLRKHNFHSLLNPARVLKLEPPVYSMEMDQASGVRNADRISAFARDQADMLEEVINENAFALTIGGDCSILIGNSLCLKRRGRYGLFFLDGHTDFMWPSLSLTGGAAGMDLAIVTGYGHDKLTDIDSQKPYFEEQHVWCVGNRDYEEWYVKAIENSVIHYVDLNKLRQNNIAKCVDDFQEMVRSHNLDGFWIHIDVDVLNDNIMPIVDSRQPDGLNYNEFNEILRLLITDPKATGLEITILDPDLDTKGEYTREFVNNFCSVFNSLRRINQTGRGHTTSILLDAPPELVWEVWTKPEHISNWWGPDGFTNTIESMQVKPGGEWLFTMHGPDGVGYRNRTIFREVVANKKIVHEHFAPNFISVVEFEKQGEKTLMNWSKEYETRELYEMVEIQYKANEGFKQTINKLKVYLFNLQT